MKSNVSNRTYMLGVRLKPQEKDYLKREADERGQRVSDYVRDVLLATMNFKTAPVDKLSA